MYQLPIIDSDVHHTWKSHQLILDYLPKRWRDIVTSNDGRKSSLEPGAIWTPHTYGHRNRLDSTPPDGSPGGSDYLTLKQQYLDAYNVQKVVLSFDIGSNGGLPNPYLASEVVRAINDWNKDHWLGIDDARLASAILVPMQQPDEAAKEIRRVAGHPKLVEILLVANPLGQPFGHPIYDPIYEAAVEVGLPVAIHAGGEINGGAARTVAGGIPNSRLEFHTLFPQCLQHHLSSYIVHGTFEKFPSLKVMLVEAGVAWAPWMMWGLDRMFETLRKESHWVKRPPTEYFRQHVRMTSQPFENSTRPQDVVDYLESFEGLEDVICFATDYPHWDADDPTYILRRIPKSWHLKVFHNNAAKFYGWPEKASIDEGSQAEVIGVAPSPEFAL